MSLIPSESASFSDLLGRGLGASKKSKWRAPQVLDQPPAAAKVEAAVKQTPPADVAEKSSQPVESESIPSAPVPAIPAKGEPISEEVDPPIALEEALDTEMAPLAPLSASTSAKVEPISEPAPSPGLTASALLSLLSGKFKAVEPAPPGKFKAVEPVPLPSGSEESPHAVESELTPLEPLPPVAEKAVPSEPLLDIIPDPVVTPPREVVLEELAVTPAHPEPIGEAPAPIPVVPIARSNPAAAEKSEAVAPTEAAKAKSESAACSIVPPPRPPQAKPRLRPRPNLHPRFESDAAPAATSQPPAPAPPATGNPESVTDLEYLAPDIPTHAEDFQYTEAAEEGPDARRRRRNKFLRFVSCIVVSAVLVISLFVGWSQRLGGSLSLVGKASAIVSAIAVVVLAILFYGLPEKPRDQP